MDWWTEETIGRRHLRFIDTMINELNVEIINALITAENKG